MAATKPLSVTLEQFYVTLRGEFVVKSISFPQRFHFPLAFPDTFVKADPVPCSALPTTQGNRHQLMALLGSRFPHFSYFLPFWAFFWTRIGCFYCSGGDHGHGELLPGSGAAAVVRQGRAGALGVLAAARFSSVLSRVSTT